MPRAASLPAGVQQGVTADVRERLEELLAPDVRIHVGVASAQREGGCGLATFLQGLAADHVVRGSTARVHGGYVCSISLPA